MDRTLRSILWVLVGLVVLSSFSAGWFFVAKERLYTEYLNLENLFKTSMERANREISLLDKEKTTLASKLETLERELSILGSKNKELASRYEELLREKDDLRRTLAKVKKGKIFLEKRLRDMESDKFMAGLLKEKASLEVELRKLKEGSGPRDLELGRLRTENNALNTRVSVLQSEKALLERRLDDSKQVAELLSRDLLKEKNRGKAENLEFERLKSENRLLSARIRENEDIYDKLNRLMAEKEAAQLRVASLERDLEAKNEEIRRVKLAFEDERRNREELRAEAYHPPAEVDLPRIVLEREDVPKSRPSSISYLERIDENFGLKGRIVTVNREHAFVVIDLGRQSGIDIGTRFNVYRGEFPIGNIEVIQTRERISACDIKEVKEGFQIEIDDVIVKR